MFAEFLENNLCSGCIFASGGPHLDPDPIRGPLGGQEFLRFGLKGLKPLPHNRFHLSPPKASHTAIVSQLLKKFKERDKEYFPGSVPLSNL
jgi:hypothetical protein